MSRLIHPSWLLHEEYLDPLRLDPSGLALALDIAGPQIVPVPQGDRPMTSDMALRLARYFSTGPRFWLGSQTACDLAIAQVRLDAQVEAQVQPLPA